MEITVAISIHCGIFRNPKIFYKFLRNNIYVFLFTSGNAWCKFFLCDIHSFLHLTFYNILHTPIQGIRKTSAYFRMLFQESL